MELSELKKKLPPICAGRLPSTGETILIRFGETGYYPGSQYNAEEFDREAGVTPEQAEAMFSGSVFGWHTPAANPDIYIVENGEVVGVKHDDPAPLVNEREKRLADALVEMTASLIEAHMDELQDGHGGDADHDGEAPEACSYCRQFAAARELLNELGYDTAAITPES